VARRGLPDFSYNRSGELWEQQFGRGYDPCDTLASIWDDEVLLQTELGNFAYSRQGVDVYLVGHSQGGVIALAYPAYLQATGQSLSDSIPGLTLAGVVSLDSPVGGVDAIAKAAADLKSLLQCGVVGPADFATFRSVAQTVPLDGAAWPWGGEASLLDVWRRAGLSIAEPVINQQAAEAAGAAGITVLSVGNLRDESYFTSGFYSTQFLEDGPPGSNVYAREIHLAESCAGEPLDDYLHCQLSHGAVQGAPVVNRGIDRLLHGLPPDNDLVSWVGQNDGEHWQAPRSVADAAVHVPVDAAGGVVATLTGLGRLTIGTGAMAKAGEVALSAVQRIVTLPTGATQAGAPYEVGGLDLATGASATLTFPYSSAVGALGGSFVVLKEAPTVAPLAPTADGTAPAAEDAALVPVPTTVDAATGMITAQVEGDGTYVPVALAAPSVTGPSSPTNSAVVDFAVTFPLPVTGLAADDLSVTGSAAGCTVGEPVATGDTAYTAAVTGCGEGTVVLALKAGSVSDAAGNPGPTADAASATVTVDRTLPSTAASLGATPRTGAALAGTSVPLTLTWKPATDVGSGVGGYELERSTNGGTWTAAGVYTETSTGVTAASSGTVRYRVRAVDKADNKGGWAYTATLSPRLTQQSKASVRYRGTWTVSKSSAYSGSSVKYAKVKGRSASYTFTGRSVAFVTTKAPSRGKVKVYINGVYQDTVATYRSATQYRVLAWQRTWSTSAKRTIKLVVVGTSGRPRVDLDAFVVVK
jgi:pimeloyl-ACP methyl ester carboxylesterase